MSFSFLFEFGAALPEDPSYGVKTELLEFSRSARSQEIVERVLTEPAVSIMMPAGTGKAALLSSLISMRTDALVYHVYPDPVLPVEAHRLVSELASYGRHLKAPLAVVNRPGGVWPTRGVVFVSAMVMSSHIKATTGACLVGSTVVVDQSSRADAVVAELHRTVCSRGVRCCTILAGETHSFPLALPFDEPGAVPSIAREPLAEWKSTDLNQPWSAFGTRGHFLFFLDSDQDYERIRQDYVQHVGWTVCRLRAGDGLSALKKLMCILGRPHGRVLLVADTAFRSGLAFDIPTVFDCGLTAFHSTEDGALCYRPADRAEIEAAAGRAYAARDTDAIACVVAPLAERPSELPCAQPVDSCATLDLASETVVCTDRRDVPDLDVVGKQLAVGLQDAMRQSFDTWSDEVGLFPKFSGVSLIDKQIEAVNVLDEPADILIEELTHDGCASLPSYMHGWHRQVFEPGGVHPGLICCAALSMPGRKAIALSPDTRLKLRNLVRAYDVCYRVEQMNDDERYEMLRNALMLYNVCVIELSADCDSWQRITARAWAFDGDFFQYCVERLDRAIEMYDTALHAIYAAKLLSMPDVSVVWGVVPADLSEARIVAKCRDVERFRLSKVKNFQK